MWLWTGTKNTQDTGVGTEMVQGLMWPDSFILYIYLFLTGNGTWGISHPGWVLQFPADYAERGIKQSAYFKGLPVSPFLINVMHRLVNWGVFGFFYIFHRKALMDINFISILSLFLSEPCICFCHILPRINDRLIGQVIRDLSCSFSLNTVPTLELVQPSMTSVNIDIGEFCSHLLQHPGGSSTELPISCRCCLTFFLAPNGRQTTSSSCFFLNKE